MWVLRAAGFGGKGSVGDGRIDFVVKKGTIDFLKFGEVAGAKIQGKGDFSMVVAGPFRDVWFDFGFDLKDFEMADYKLKKLVGEVKISLKKNAMYFNNLKSFQKTFRLIGDGSLLMKNKSQLNLNIKVERVSLEGFILCGGASFQSLEREV